MPDFQPSLKLPETKPLASAMNALIGQSERTRQAVQKVQHVRGPGTAAGSRCLGRQ